MESTDIQYTINGIVYKIAKEKIEKAIQDILSEAKSTLPYYVTVDNPLTVTNPDVKLGGNMLVQDTTIDKEDFIYRENTEWPALPSRLPIGATGTVLPYHGPPAWREYILPDQYFTPSIEDITIDYECETHDGTEWRGCIISQGDLSEHLKWEHFQLRVPYLTVSQMEKEGWERVNDTKNNYMKGHVHISHFLDTYSMAIYHGNPVEGNTIFYGECKDINTFRYICKLLGI